MAGLAWAFILVTAALGIGFVVSIVTVPPPDTGLLGFMESHLHRVPGIKLAAPTLVFGLEKFGWIRGTGMDGGCFDEHSKPFPAANVTAVVHYEGNVDIRQATDRITSGVADVYLLKDTNEVPKPS